MNLQWYDIAIILVLVLILFGPKRLPELARGLGTAINEFKGAMSSGAQQVSSEPKKLEQPDKSKDEEKPAG